jgi:hypothetical protein
LWLLAETKLAFRSCEGTGDLIADDTPFGGREVGIASGTVRFEGGLVEDDELEARGDEVATTAEAKEGGQTGAGAAGALVGPGRDVLDERAAAAA